MTTEERLAKLESKMSAVEVALSVLSLQGGSDMSETFADIMNTLGQFSDKVEDKYEAEFYNSLSKRIYSLREITGKEKTSVSA